MQSQHSYHFLFPLPNANPWIRPCNQPPPSSPLPLLTKRYDPGQQYQPHHDFSDAGVVHQRFLTLLLYISPAQEGGATSFPKAHSGRGLRVRPPKGSGVLFYSMLPDGNGDDLSLHAGEPVTVGRKWVCNLWVWDPKRGSGRL